MLLARATTGPAAALLVAAALAGCGSEPQSTDERLAESVQDAVAGEIPPGPSHRVLDARCLDEERQQGRYRCTVDIAANPDAIQETVAVTLGDDGCWTTRRIELRHATGRAVQAAELEPQTLRGCLR